MIHLLIIHLKFRFFINQLRFLALLIFFACNISTHAQQLEWVDGFKNNGGTISEIELDSIGNIYVTGWCNTSTVDFDPGLGVTTLTCASGDCLFLCKYNSLGSLIWAKSLDESSLGCYGNVFDIKLDKKGNIYLGGYFIDTCNFDTFNLTTNQYDNAFILKLNNEGDVVWASNISGPAREGVFSLDVDNFGNVLASGLFNGTTDFDSGIGTFSLTSVGESDIFITKYDSVGTFVWAKQIGNTSPNPIFSTNSISVDRVGNVYVTGDYSGALYPTDFDPGPDTFYLNHIRQQTFITKLKANGDFLWVKEIIGNDNSNGQGGSIGKCIAVDTNNYVYIAGEFAGTVSFVTDSGTYNFQSVGTRDGYVAKLDSTGNFLWIKGFGGSVSEWVYNIALDSEGSVYLAGEFYGTSDFDPSPNVYNISYTPGYIHEGFISKLNSSGDFSWARSIGAEGIDKCTSIKVDNYGKVIIAGYFASTVDFDFTSAQHNLIGSIISNPNDGVFISKYTQKGVVGTLFFDVDSNCIQGNNESGISIRNGIIQPGNILIQTDYSGHWYLDSLPVGNYVITYDTSGNWRPTCPNAISFSVTNDNALTYAPSLGLINTQPCAYSEVSIFAYTLRRCFLNQVICVQARNQYTATGALNSAYVDVELDSLLTPTSASLSYTNLGNNKYRFNVGNINPGQSVNFTINTTVSCAANLQQTLCMEARLFPADSCVFDAIPAPPIAGDSLVVPPCNLPWDHSSLSVDGYCANDTVYFTVTNNGSNMLCNTPVRVFVNDTFTYVYSILLAAGQSITYSYASMGQTWILQADQHPLHPGNSHPNAHVEACGNIANWTPGLVNNLPLDDADPIVDIYCGVVSGAYDPNDKTGFPTGLGTEHEILPNQQLQYLIRFQNTGTDTAFNIVVRDTLDTDLNIFSVVPGVASHNYSFRMYGPRVLEWSFNNIMLPDSNVNEVLSHGFLTYTVEQQPNLMDGTTITNDADIYFDFNEPVITNETVHTINNWLNAFPVGIAANSAVQSSLIKVYPNPTKGSVHVELNEASPKTEVMVLNVLGQQISKQQFYNVSSCNLTIEGEPGVYLVKVVSEGRTEYVKLLKL